MPGFGDYTAAELLDAAARCAGLLQSHGVRPGDAVAILMSNRPEWIHAFFGASWAGAVVVPLNNSLRGPILESMLARPAPRVVIVEDTLSDVAVNAIRASGIDTALLTAGESGDFAAAVDAAQRGTEAERSAEDLSSIMFTSGTTGPSQGVMLTHGALAASSAKHRRLVGLGESDVAYSCLPLYHTNALVVTFMTSLRVGAISEGELKLRLHYNDVGQGAETVVMLHGSGPGASGWANFHRNIEPLVAAGYRVILMDCPGWSKSDPVVCDGSRSDLNARALKGLLDVLDLNSVHIVGNSMGAHSTVAFALENPERIGKLILMGGGTGGPSAFVPQPTEGIKLIGALYREPTIENLKKMMNVFVFDASSLTDELFQTRLDNILARRDHLENFVKSSNS